MRLQAQLSLLRLVSPALPVGAFSYSRGLEPAVAADWVCDEQSAGAFILGVLEHAVCPLDGAVLCRLHRAWSERDQGAVLHWTRVLRAFRESCELLLEDEQMGIALGRLLTSLGVAGADAKVTAIPPSYTNMFALAAVHWGIDLPNAIAGFFFAYCEGQVSVALRLLPLGQTAGQRMLERAMPVVERCVERATSLDDAEIGNFCAGLALASARHETQYSRLFRS
jgi:urease accessory protein